MNWWKRLLERWRRARRLLAEARPMTMAQMLQQDPPANRAERRADAKRGIWHWHDVKRRMNKKWGLGL